MTYDSVVTWISQNYSPSDFGVNEDKLKEKLIEDGRYNFDDEIEDARDKLLSENSNFSDELLDKIYTKTAFRDSLVLAEIDVERLRKEAQQERTRIQQAESRKKREELLEQGINPDF